MASEWAFSLGDNSVFKGTIVANGAISLLEGSALYGQVLTKAGAVDLHNNIIMQVAIPVVAAITGNTNVCVGKQTTLNNTTLNGTWASSNTAVATVDNAGIVSGITSGLATISYTVANTNGCVTTSTKFITIDALPAAVAAITGTTSVCVTSTTQLSTTTTGGVWSSSNAAIATINTTGLVNGVAAGTTIITYTVTNLAGCISSNSVIITVKANSTSTTSLSICPSALPYVWNGLTFTTAGTQTATLVNAVGCDSATSLNLSVKTNTTSSTNQTACTSYLWNGVIYTTSGNKTFTNSNSQGCDSVATLVLIINSVSTSTTNTSICPSTLPYVWNGLTFTIAGTQTATLVNAVGCDSAATLNLTVKTNATSSTNQTACTSYLWNGVTYTTSGNKTFTTTNSQGCDSVATLVLIINSVSTSTTNTSICPSSLPYVWNGLTFTTAGTQTATLVNAVGCDSATSLNLIVKTNTTSSTNQTACTSYLWNGVIYTTSGNKTFTTSNSQGCDSVATLVLTINSVSTSTTNISICPSALPYVWNGLTFTIAGTQTATLVNAFGCDSAATLNLTVKTNTTSSTNQTACTSYLWNGVIYTTSGNKTFTTTNSQGCDSVATLVLIINSISTSTTNTSICPSAFPYVWNGLTFTTAGTQTATLVNAVGCDSATSLNLSVKTNTTSSTNQTACTSYLWNGVTYTTSGNKTFTTTNSQGCDSVATLVLIINSVSTSTTNTSICPSALPYVWNGLTFTIAGTQTATLVNAVGCDSAATLNLTIDVAPASPIITVSSTTVVGGQTGVVYTCSTVANATSYTWSFSGTGATISGNGTNAITVNFAGTATGGDIAVMAVNGASCSSLPAIVTVAVTPLPVVLSSFNAEKLNNTVLVKWTTVTEVNSKSFEVQKSIDGKNFFTIATVEAKGNNTSVNKYSLVDAKPFVGINYYRLKQIDNDGKYNLSMVKTVLFDSDGKFVVNIYPNPATDVINVRLTNGVAKQINILNTLGKIVFTTNVMTVGATQVSIKNLSAGTYFVEIISNENRAVEKFLKN